MRKREQFAVSLRKQKTKDIIAHKRRRLLDSVAEKSEVCMMSSSINADRSLPEYSGFYKFNKDNQAWLGQLLTEIAPDFAKCDDQVSLSSRFAVRIEGVVAYFVELAFNFLYFLLSLPRLSMQSSNCVPKTTALLTSQLLSPAFANYTPSTMPLTLRT